MTQSRNGECCSLPQLGGPFPQSSVSYFSAARQHGLNGWQGFMSKTLYSHSLTEGTTKGLSKEQKYLTVYITTAGIIKAALIIL